MQNDTKNKILFWFFVVALFSAIPALLEVILFNDIYNNSIGAFAVAIAPVVLLSSLYCVVKRFLDRFPKFLMISFILFAILTILFEAFLAYIWFAIIQVMPISKF